MKKALCFLCCCLSIFFWGCKVETVQQHQQAASPSQQAAVSSGSQNSVDSRPVSNENGSESQASFSSVAESGVTSSQAPESREEDQALEAPASKETAGSSVSSSESPKREEAPAQEMETASLWEDSQSAPSQPPASRQETPSQGGSESQPVSSEPEQATVAVSVSVLCPIAVGHPELNPGVVLPADGVMVSGLAVTLSPGQTAFDALVHTGLALDYSGSPASQSVYLKGIGGLYERDCGPASGWVFSVNGTYLNAGCSNVVLNDGDQVVFQFTDGTLLR